MNQSETVEEIERIIDRARSMTKDHSRHGIEVLILRLEALRDEILKPEDVK